MTISAGVIHGGRTARSASFTSLTFTEEALIPFNSIWKVSVPVVVVDRAAIVVVITFVVEDAVEVAWEVVMVVVLPVTEAVDVSTVLTVTGVVLDDFAKVVAVDDSLGGAAVAAEVANIVVVP